MKGQSILHRLGLGHGSKQIIHDADGRGETSGRDGELKEIHPYRIKDDDKVISI